MPRRLESEVFYVSRMSVALRAGIPPFYVMDVWLAAAERQRTPRRPGQPVGRAAERRGTRGRSCRGEMSAGQHRPRLHRRARHPGTARRDRGSYQDRHGLAVDPADVVITTGSAADSCWRSWRASTSATGWRSQAPDIPATAISCRRWAARWSRYPAVRTPDSSRLHRCSPTWTHPCAGVIVASPANPTGTVIPPEELAAIAPWCATSGVRLISDEVYHGLVYEGAPDTSCAWPTSRDAVVVNSFSKYFAMTGWRLGWLLVPRELRVRWTA